MAIGKLLLRRALKSRKIRGKAMSSAQKRALMKAVKASAAKRAGRKMAIKAAGRTFAKKTLAFSRTRAGTLAKAGATIYAAERITRKKANNKKNKSVNLARVNEFTALGKAAIALDAKILASVIKNTGKVALGMQTGRKAKRAFAGDAAVAVSAYSKKFAKGRINTARAKKNLKKYKKAKSQ